LAPKFLAARLTDERPAAGFEELRLDFARVFRERRFRRVFDTAVLCRMCCEFDGLAIDDRSVDCVCEGD
jgi:hypothetical protein